MKSFHKIKKFGFPIAILSEFKEKKNRRSFDGIKMKVKKQN